MRLVWILLTVLVFGAMLLFDTAALLQLTWYCVSGNCGVRPLWIGVTAFAVVSVLFVLARLGRRTGAGGRLHKAASEGRDTGEVLEKV